MKTYVLISGLALGLSGCYATNPRLTGPSRTPAPIYNTQMPVVQNAPAAPDAPPAPVALKAPPVPKAVHISHFPLKSKVAAIAFEDNYPNPGDQDYNDFLADFSINETIDPDDNLTHITIDFYPRAVGAWYDSELLLLLNGVKQGKTNLTFQQPDKPLFHGAANVKLIHYDGEGNLIDTKTYDANGEVVVFASSHALFGVPAMGNRKTLVNTYADLPVLKTRANARVDIEILDPTKNHVTSKAFDIGRYRMVLHVKQKTRDAYVDLIDVDPQSFDSNGFPRGFVVQSDWQWPQEGIKIGQVYSNFDAYRQFLLDKKTRPELTAPESVMEWYLQPADQKFAFPKQDVSTPQPKM